jgi:hypothetical protein
MEEIDLIYDKIVYLAVYNPDTFRVTKVGPSYAFENEKHKVVIEEHIALSIIEGTTRLSSCFIDIDSQTLELVEKNHVVKIDDILHRISDKRWNKNKLFEIYLTYYTTDKSFKVQMTSLYSGTKKVNSKKTRRISWNGDTLMNFYITEYNDPHVPYRILSFTVNDLINKSVVIKDIELPKKFSVYTRRMFKDYILEVK